MENSENIYTHITAQDFSEKVLNASQLVIADFFADSSSACKILDPEFEAVGKMYQGRVTFVKVSVEQNVELVDKWNVDGIPTLIFFKNGQEIYRIKGIIMRDKLRRQVEGALLAS